jgi:hypothetical protein
VRFFTMDWWCSVESDDRGDPLPKYQEHLASIRDQLPVDLLATQETVSLHDTRLRELRFVVDDSSLVLELESYTGDERFALVYSGVERFESSADPKVGLRGPHGYGDLGYCEVDLRTTGAFEHRILFSTGIELVVVFRTFSLRRSGEAGETASVG